MIKHILPPGSLGTEEMMKRQWHVRREAVELPDAQDRWDRAYQAILRWSLENEQARAPSAEGKELLGEHEWWLGKLAREIRMPEPTLYAWARRGWTKAHQLQDHPQRRWVVWADEAELERLRRLNELPTGYHTRRKWIESEGDDERVPR